MTKNLFLDGEGRPAVPSFCQSILLVATEQRLGNSYRQKLSLSGQPHPTNHKSIFKTASFGSLTESIDVDRVGTDSAKKFSKEARSQDLQIGDKKWNVKFDPGQGL